MITLFLLGHVNRWFEGKLQRELPSGARTVGHQFAMPNRRPAAAERIDQVMLYLWVKRHRRAVGGGPMIGPDPARLRATT